MPRFGYDGSVKSRRCSTCSIQYPPFVEVCRICGEGTSPMYKSGPDDDWQERVAQSLGEGVYLDPPKIGYVEAHPNPDANIPLHVVDGQLWFGHHELIGIGYKHLEPGKIVLVGGRFYELNGYSQKWNAWWIEEIPVDGAADDLTPEMFTVWKPED